MGANFVAMIPECELEEFCSLPYEVQQRVTDLLEVMGTASRTDKHRRYLLDVAKQNQHRRGWNHRTLEVLFWKMRDTGDWHVLIDKAKAPDQAVVSKWVTPAVIQCWRETCDRHPRSYKTAWIEFIARYRAGEMMGNVDWKAYWPESERAWEQPPKTPPPDMPIPPGWKYGSIIRHKPLKIEATLSRHGPHEARKFAERVHTTRANLPVGARFEFDEMWHNHPVIVWGFEKAVRPLEIRYVDVASDWFYFGVKPRLEDLEGKRVNLRLREMLVMLAHLLCVSGFHKDGCVLVVEHGATGIHPNLEKLLRGISGGRIRVSRSSVDRSVPRGKWGYERAGNPDLKTHIEGQHNLLQNRLDALPGYMGGNSRLDKPEDFDALVNDVNKMLKACNGNPALAEKMRFPIPDWDTFKGIVDTVYNEVLDSRDHNLEGWQNRMVRQWRAHSADTWKNEAEYHAMPENEKRNLELALRDSANHRVEKMSRREAWEAGQADLVRLPGFAAAMICAPLAVERKCPPAEIVFVLEGAKEFYRVATCAKPSGKTVELRENKTYKWLINPLNPGEVFVYSEKGAFLGTCAQAAAIDRNDDEAVKARIVETRKSYHTAISDYNTRNTPRALKIAADMEHNTRVLTEADAGGRVSPRAAPPLDETRQRAADEIDLEDLSCASAPDLDDENQNFSGLDDLL